MAEVAGPRARRWGYRRLGWAVVAAAVLLTACGPDSAAPGSGGGLTGPSDDVGRLEPPRGDSAGVLAKWQAFPVTADPRPLVMPGGAVLDPATGFQSNEDKLAYIAGNFELATAAPAAPATSAGYAIVSAEAALDRLRATGSSQPPNQPLRIVEVSLAQATFGTDRGPQNLPAWRFQLEHVRDPVRVLAIDSKHLWGATDGAGTRVDQRASLSEDGRSLTFSFYGSPAGPSPCGADYTASVAESRTAVVVTPRQIRSNSQDSSSTQACPAIAAKRTVTVRLAAPLGARVVLTSEGEPVPVTSP